MVRAIRVYIQLFTMESDSVQVQVTGAYRFIQGLWGSRLQSKD